MKINIKQFSFPAKLTIVARGKGRTLGIQKGPTLSPPAVHGAGRERAGHVKYE